MAKKTPCLWDIMNASIRLVLGGLFVWSSATKFRQVYDFLSTVYDYELVTPAWGVLLAAAIPWMECAIGVSLITGLLERGALLLSVFLLSLFALAELSVLSRGLEVACGCFGKGQAPITPPDALRTLAMLAAAVFGLLCSLACSIRAGRVAAATAPANQSAEVPV